MRISVCSSLIALSLVLAVAAGAEEQSGNPPAPPETKARATAAGACYLRFGQETACVTATTEEQCQRACDERLCDEIVWYPQPGCWEWGWIGPSPR